MPFSAVNPSLLDIVQRSSPDGKMLPIIELINTAGGALSHLGFMEANDRLAHRSAIRTGIPTGTFRALYQGVDPEKSTVAQVSDTIGNLESYSEVDYGLAQLNDMKAEFMLSEQLAFIEGLGQTQRRAFYYANEALNPAKWTGLAPRYSTFTVANAANAVNVLDAGGASDAAGNLQSAWLLTFSPAVLHGIYPRGVPDGGLSFEVKNGGQPVTSETFLNSAGSAGRMEVLRTWYKWQMGLVLKDWRFNARVCNISVKVGGSNTKSVYDFTGGGTNYTTNLDLLLRKMISAAERLPAINYLGGETIWFVSRQVRESLRFAILNKLTSNLTWETVSGKRVMMFDGIPVERDDALTGLDADGTTNLEPLVT